MAFFGPLFGSELHRLARRRHLFWLRVQFAALLLLVLYVVYASWFDQFGLSRLFAPAATVSLSTSAQFAASFVYGVMVVQFLAVILLTPIFVGSGVAEEIDKRTVEYLFVTEVTDREIVLGKLFSRLVFVLGLLLTGLPIAAMSAFFGGVSMSLLVQSYALLVSLTFLLGSFTMFVGSRRGDLRATMLTSFGCTFLAFALAAIPALAIPFGGTAFAPPAEAPLLCPPVHLHHLFQADPGTLQGFTLKVVAGHVVLGLLFLAGSYHDLRARLLRDKTPARISDRSSLPDPRGYSVGTVPGGWRIGEFEGAAPTRLQDRPLDREEVSFFGRQGANFREPLNEDAPLLWKERNHRSRSSFEGIHGWVARLLVLLFLVAVAAIFSMLVLFLAEPGQNRQPINWCVRVFGFAILMVCVLGIGAGGAVSVAREREQGTLDSLLTLPVDRSEILAAKWWATISPRSIWPGYFLITLITLGLISGAIWLGHVVNTVVFVLGLLTLVASLGVWFSAASRTGLRATLALLGTGLVVVLAPYVLANSVPSWIDEVLPPSVTLEDARVVVESLGPWEVWQTLNQIPRGDFPTGTWNPAVYSLRVIGACISTGFAFGLGYLFWFLARRRFEREGKS